MRLATFNVLHGMSPADGRVDLTRFPAEIGALGADVLGLQEVDRGQSRSGQADLAALAASAVGADADYRYVPALTGTPGGRWGAATDADEDRPDKPSYGIALVTRLAVRCWHVVRLRPAPMRSPVVVAGTRARLALLQDEPRALLAAVVDGPGGRLTVATTHLSFVPGWNAWQLRRVCAELRRLPAPRILLGDLNLPGPLMRTLSGWRVLAKAATYPSPKPWVQLDHVLGHGTLPAVTGVQARALTFSDHCALVVDLSA